MKTIKYLSLLALAFIAAACNKQNLPYELDAVQHGVVINIHKPLGSSAVLHLDKSDVFDIILDIPSLQGDYSMMKEAQVSAVFTNTNGKKFCHAIEGIKNFPCTLQVSMNDVCTKLGITTLEVGDKVEFTPSYTLNNGTQVNGWNQYSGFNNTVFAGWNNDDGTAVSYKIFYSAFAPFDKNDYVKTGIVADRNNTPVVTTLLPDGEFPAPADLPAGITNADLVGYKIAGDFWFCPDELKFWVNTKDYTLIIPDQVISPMWTFPGYGTYDGTAEDATGDLTTLTKVIHIYFYSGWGPYSLGEFDCDIQY